MKSIHDSRYHQLIAELIAAREQRGVTQVELALALRKPQSYIAKIENFDRRLDIVELADWLTALQIKPSEFLKTQAWF
jgi:transcriptional regulator with XRE-family HTH domain